ncbi:hypothetical protein DL771_005817 [Monosporascus sp. 5C6A]|nr:hypothetical protein DL771_005817 [Monosporascus sp. 5C6A]
MAPRRWALLCGGDFYFEGTARNNNNNNNLNSGEGKIRSYPHLRGCVRDVNAMHAFLVEYGVDPANIARLRATCLGDDNTCSRPVEEEGLWPTYRNIERELNRITDKAARGDLVYIHYSGHGIRRHPAQPNTDDGGDSIRGMALVMTDVLRGGSYLTGYQLGAFVKKMVEERGLRVTLVLDSCYSGRAIRNSCVTNASSRTVPGQYDDSLLESDIRADALADAIMNTATASAVQRGVASIRKSWLSSPTGCTVVTACGPHEAAVEGCFDTSVFVQGALSYCILDVLRESKGYQLPSHTRVVRRVRRRLKSIIYGQSPGLLGDGSYEFFGATSYIERPACSVTAVRHGGGHGGGEIDLGVGEVQGVAVGALYDIFRDMDHDDNNSIQVMRRAQVTHTSLFKSTAMLLPGSSIEELDDGRDWVAVLRQWALPNAVGVRFITKDQVLVAKLEAQLQKYPGLELINNSDSATSDDTRAAAFTVTIGQGCTYEVFQAGLRLPHLPSISVVSNEFGIDKLAYVLSHVSRFQALRKLVENTKSSPPWQPQAEADKFMLEIKSSTDPSKTIMETTSAPAYGSVQAEEGGKLDISLTYDGSFPTIYGSLFCFDATWGISKLHPSVEAGRVSEPGVPGYPFLEVTLEMVIPNKSSNDITTSVTDVLVAFVSTAEHVSWDEICLGPLPVDGGAVGKLMVVNNDGANTSTTRSSNGSSVLLPHNTTAQNWTTRPAKVVTKEILKNPGWTALGRVVQTSSTGTLGQITDTTADPSSSKQCC